MFVDVKLFKDIFVMFKLFDHEMFVSICSFFREKPCNILLENDLA